MADSSKIGGDAWLFFENPNNSAFQTSLNAKIYVDKTGLIEYTNGVLASTDAYICNSRPRRFICLLRIIAKVVIQKKCFRIWKLENQGIFGNI